MCCISFLSHFNFSGEKISARWIVSGWVRLAWVDRNAFWIVNESENERNEKKNKNKKYNINTTKLNKQKRNEPQRKL